MKIEDLGFTRMENPRGVAFFAKHPGIVIDRYAVNLLLEEITGNNKDARICLHSSPDDPLHNMIIASRSDNAPLPAHRHPQKAETIQGMQGRVRVILFDDEGIQTASAPLDGGDMFRIGPNVWHMVIAVSPIAIYNESKVGLFLGDADREFAPWAK